jgi:hypothetical protein
VVDDLRLRQAGGVRGSRPASAAPTAAACGRRAWEPAVSRRTPGGLTAVGKAQVEVRAARRPLGGGEGGGATHGGATAAVGVWEKVSTAVREAVCVRQQGWRSAWGVYWQRMRRHGSSAEPGGLPW